MYIIIAGGGLIGKGLAKELVEHKHDVVVIDMNQCVCEEIYAKYGTVSINGNATNLETLENARIEKCDVAVAVMTQDSDNLAFALLAKHFKVPQVLVRLNDPQYEDVYKSLGVHHIARTTQLLIDQLIINIESPELRKVISLKNIEICIVNVPEKSLCSGMTIASLVKQNGFPEGIVITCIYTDSKNAFVVPRGDTTISPKDRLFLCGSHSNIKKAAKIICNE